MGENNEKYKQWERPRASASFLVMLEMHDYSYIMSSNFFVKLFVVYMRFFINFKVPWQWSAPVSTSY